MASKEKSLNSQNDHQEMRAKLGAKPFYSRQHYWTTMDKICAALLYSFMKPPLNTAEKAPFEVQILLPCHSMKLDRNTDNHQRTTANMKSLYKPQGGYSGIPANKVLRIPPSKPTKYFTGSTRSGNSSIHDRNRPRYRCHRSSQLEPVYFGKSLRPLVVS